MYFAREIQGSQWVARNVEQACRQAVVLHFDQTLECRQPTGEIVWAPKYQLLQHGRFIPYPTGITEYRRFGLVACLGMSSKKTQPFAFCTELVELLQKCAEAADF